MESLPQYGKVAPGSVVLEGVAHRDVEPADTEPADLEPPPLALVDLPWIEPTTRERSRSFQA